MGAPGKPFHEKPPVVTEARTSKPGPEAPGQMPAEALDAAFAQAAPQALRSPAADGSGNPALPSGSLAGSPQWQQFFQVCQRLQGFPRHLSIHVGGMLVTSEPLVDLMPVERATMPGRVVVQFNKDDVEDLGLIKMDMLGLRTLSVVEECLQLTAARTGERPDLDALDLKDPEVYRTASEADTVGVFQIESRAQMATLPRTRPDKFSDLVVEVAIIRPGPIQGNAVNPYIRRRQGREPVTYLHPKLEPILRDSLGVILFQEQILQIAMDLGGYTPSQADGFRRAMDRHRHQSEMDALRDDFLVACRLHSGVDSKVGNELFKSISGFAQFGFCRCLAGDTRVSDPITGRTATLAELADAFDESWGGGPLLAPPVTAVLSHAAGQLVASAVTAVYRNGIRPVYRVTSESGRAITTTGNHPFLTPQGYRQLDDLAPGVEVAIHWSGADIYWEKLRSIEPRGEAETFDLTVTPHHNFVADGFVVHNSHAAAFARTTYETVWLKNHHPAEYYCALLNNQPMGFYHPSVLVDDAKRHGVAVLPVDINLSRERCLPLSPKEMRTVRVKAPAGGFRLGFNYVRGIGDTGLDRVKAERLRGEFKDLRDFCDRVCSPAPGGLPVGARVKPEAVENLVMVGAFDSWDIPRRELLWQVREAVEDAGSARLVTASVEPLALPVMSELEVTASDYRVLEVTTGRHLVSYYRDQLSAVGAIDSRGLGAAGNDTRVKIGGLVITRQAPGTAKNFRFFTLEDEWGHINLILHPDFFAKHRAVANRNQMLMFEGVVQNVDNVISVKATDVWALAAPEIALKSHDFR
jgi:DNA polymerase III alpha subunit